MHIDKLVYLARLLNGAMTFERFRRIPPEEIQGHIAAGTIFEFMGEALEIQPPLYYGFDPIDRLELTLEWAALEQHVAALPWTGEQNGVAMLMNYVLWGIERRARQPRHRLTLEPVCAGSDEGTDPRAATMGNDSEGP